MQHSVRHKKKEVQENWGKGQIVLNATTIEIHIHNSGHLSGSKNKNK